MSGRSLKFIDSKHFWFSDETRGKITLILNFISTSQLQSYRASINKNLKYNDKMLNILSRI